MGTSLVNWLGMCIFYTSPWRGWGGWGLPDELLLRCAVDHSGLLVLLGSKQCGEMSRCPHVVAAWAVKLREWALWLAGSSFPFMDKKCHHKINTVTKTTSLHTSGQSLPVSEGYTRHAPIRRYFAIGLLFFFTSCLASAKSILNFDLLLRHVFCSTSHSGHTNIQTNTHTHAHVCILAQGIASINKRDAAREFAPRQQLCFCDCSAVNSWRCHTCFELSAAKNVFLIRPRRRMVKCVRLDGIGLRFFWSVYTGYTSYTQTLTLTPYTLMSLHSSLGCLSSRSSSGAPDCQPPLAPVLFSLLHSASHTGFDTRTHLKGERWDEKDVGLENVFSVHLFVPLLMKVTQEDVCFLCYNNCGKNIILSII